MLVYPICIQTYDQVYILRIWSKLRLHHAVLLGFGLKMATIALSIVKVGMHSYFPNAYLSLWLNFNFEKLVKRKLRCAVLLSLRLKGVKIFLNVSKVCMHACWSNWPPNLWSNLNSKNLVKARIWLKYGENSSQHRESWHALLFSKCGFKSMIKF